MLFDSSYVLYWVGSIQVFVPNPTESSYSFCVELESFRLNVFEKLVTFPVPGCKIRLSPCRRYLNTSC